MRTEAFYVLNGSNENSKCKTQGSDDSKGSVYNLKTDVKKRSV